MAKTELCITSPVSLQEEFAGVVARVKGLRSAPTLYVNRDD